MKTLTKAFRKFISFSSKKPILSISILALMFFIMVIYGAQQFADKNIYVIGGYFFISLITSFAVIWILYLVKITHQ